MGKYNYELSEIKNQLLIITTIKWWALPFVFPFWLIISISVIVFGSSCILIEIGFNLFDIVMNKITK